MTEILSSFAAVVVAFLPLSLKREISLYLPLVLGLGMLFLLFGSVPFLMGLLRRERFLAGFFSTASPTGAPNAHLIGPYRVIATIGAGGMGTVYKGVDLQGRAVAIKMIGGSQLRGTVLHQAKKNANFRIGLVREAKLAAGLRHPNIVEVYDIGQHNGALYVAMELLDGMPLDRYAKTHAISAPEALRIVAQLCDALDCAHSHGIIHRDIKPANTFITTKGAVKVVDFGIALPPDESRSFGGVAGTPEYMSPEQILDQEVDGRADIWSAGVTLFQLLTTKTPFRGNSMTELRDKILSSPTPRLPFVGELAEQLNTSLGKALAKHRGERYVSAREFASDLRLILHEVEKNEIRVESFQSHLTQPAQTEDSVHGRPTYESPVLGFRVHAKTPAPIRSYPIPTHKGRTFRLELVGILSFAGVMTG